MSRAPRFSLYLPPSIFLCILLRLLDEHINHPRNVHTTIHQKKNV